MNKAKQLLEDLKDVVKEAKLMGCKEVRTFSNVQIEKLDIIISALEEQLNNSWIPVREKLPPLGACIICTVRDHYRNQFELRYPVYYLQKTYENGYAFYFGDTNNPLLPDISEVIAWMPLPEPYEEGKE